MGITGDFLPDIIMWIILLAITLLILRLISGWVLKTNRRIRLLEAQLYLQIQMAQKAGIEQKHINKAIDISHGEARF